MYKTILLNDHNKNVLIIFKSIKLKPKLFAGDKKTDDDR
jgi:hypothetical protein